MLWRFRQRLGDWIKGVRSAEEGLPLGQKDLSGDRYIEWSYVISRMGSHVSLGDRVLDFGCGSGMLSTAACVIGCNVTAIDLLPKTFSLEDERISLSQRDVMDLPEDRGYDMIVHASVIEHVGLWGRYKEQKGEEKDFLAMQKLRKLLRQDGVMIMTLPVGMDEIVHPYHRIYGKERLPLLMDGFSVKEESFWRKHSDNRWHPCCRDEACQEKGTEKYYAIGGFVLKH